MAIKNKDLEIHTKEVSVLRLLRANSQMAVLNSDWGKLKENIEVSQDLGFNVLLIIMSEDAFEERIKQVLS